MMKCLRGLKALLVSVLLIASLMILSHGTTGLDVPPEVVSVSPASDESNVSILANISVVFNKPMNLTSEKWNITPFVPLVSSWWDNYTLNLTQIVPLTPATNYIIWVTANNTAGTPLRHYYHRYTWRFTTDCGGTCIVETIPADGAKNIDPNSGITIRFSLPADTMSVIPTVTPSIPGIWTIAWGPGNTLLTMSHSGLLDLCTTYTVFVSGVVPGPVPNPWSFTTACPGTTFVDVAASKGFAGVDGSFYAWGDYNRDGNEDLLIDGKRLFMNNGPPSYDFTDVTALAGIGGTTVNNGVWGDYDNDGWLDFYAPGGGWSTNANSRAPWDILWHNNGDGTFTNVTAAAGTVKDIYPSTAAGWGDYDLDGDIDLYVANYESATMAGYPDKLWRNNGNATFTDVTTSAKILDSGPTKHGRGVAWGDYNNDGLPDIYVSNYRITANYLWKNLGNGEFVDVAQNLNATGWYQTDNLCYDYTLGRWYGRQYAHTIGSAWADFDNDGDLDNFNANLAHKSVGNTSIPGLTYDMRGYITDDSRFFRNNGAPDFSFMDVREAAGITLKPVGATTPDLIDSPLAPCIHNAYKGDELFSNVMFSDYDLDGWQDIWIPQVYNISYAYSFLYHNNGDGTFSDVTTAANVRVWVDGYAGAWADYNNDGYPDLITRGIYPNYAYPYARAIRLFENQGSANSWLKVRLNGCTSNTAAIGARILATANGMTQMRNVEAGSGSHSQMNSLVQHFGFGDYRGSVDLLIRWPNNNTDTIAGLASNQTLLVNEPGCEIPSRVPSVSSDLSAGAGLDVALTWAKPMGDDGWAGNVTEYAVYYGTAYDQTAASYQFLGKVPAGTTEYTHVGGGIGDTNTYYYAIQTNGTAGEIRSIAQAVKFAKQLSAGEQLLSIPVPISDHSISSVLRGVTYDHVRIFDGALQDPWLSYVPGRQYNDFDAFREFEAFWISVGTGPTPFYLTVAGPILPSASIHLRAGWNLIGFPSTLPRTVADAVAGLGGNFKAIEGWDPTVLGYHLRRLGPGDMMDGGEGYWICVGSAADWTVSFVP